jgi:hypothetical protein
MSKQKAALLVLLLIVALALIAAGKAKTVDTVSVWATVQIKGGPCKGLAHYFSPCPECKVWLRWFVPVPSLTDPLRLDGYVTDEGNGCQVLNVTWASPCVQ